MIISNRSNSPPLCPLMPEEMETDLENNIITYKGFPFSNGTYFVNRVIDAYSDRNEQIRIVELGFRVNDSSDGRAGSIDVPPDAEAKMIDLSNADPPDVPSDNPDDENEGSESSNDVPNCKYKEYTSLISFEDLNARVIFKAFPNTFCFAEPRTKKLEKIICASILAVIIQVTKVTQAYLLHQGYNMLYYNRYVYLMGHTVLNGSDDECYVYESEFMLKPSVTDENAGRQYIIYLLERSGIPNVLFIFVIATLIKHFIPEKYIDDSDFILYLYGDTGTGKSMALELLMGIFYNENSRNYNIVQLSGNMEELFDRLNKVQDFGVVTDDYHPNEVAYGGKRGQITTEEIIHSKNVPGDSPHKGKNRKLLPMAAISAEDVIRKSNKTNRCVMATMSDELNSNVIKALKDNKKIYIGWLRSFVIWICNNPAKVSEIIKNLFDSFEYNSDVRDMFYGYDRIMNSTRMLYAAADVFCAYFYPDYQEDEIFDDPKKRLQDSINQSIRLTLDYNRRDMLTKPEFVDFIKEFVNAIGQYSTTDYHLFKSCCKNSEKISENCIYHDIDKDTYYLTPDHAINLIEKDHMVSKKKLGQLLDGANLIITNKTSDKNERAIKVKNLGKRVFAIYGNKLREIKNILKI
ncbi:MAG: hypothetical protein J5582_12905 [Ruminococcus sp.]|uniref:hypothetical protein n=1 Tax=Ruminococcus sp. TaxID=41978 RepID=UPI0025DC657B|nr:hypothetical protein [Ruminococcus sp.]MBO4867437.1 hypothetical protein [Ruminococcus sp.]